MTYREAQSQGQAGELGERQKLNLEQIERHVAEFHSLRLEKNRCEREKLREEYAERFGASSLFEFSKRFRQAIATALIVLPCLLCAGQGVTITIPEGIQVSVVRVSTNAVTNAVAIAPPAPMRIGAKMAKAAELQPPSPVPPPILGKQFPYISTCSALTTQSVRTVYEVKFLRAIERTAGGALETNFATLQTNTVSVTQTNTPLRPE